MSHFIHLLLLVSFYGVISKRVLGHEAINCDGFESQQCLDLAYEYYGLSPLQLSAYGAMQQAILSDSIECHYIYDVCPFYIPPLVGKKMSCMEGQIEFIQDEETGSTQYYKCSDVDLLSFLPLIHLGSNNNASGADIWGYQTLDDDDNVHKHYAITTQADGSSLVDITDPLHPNVLAFIVSNVEGELRNVLWHDVKVYKDWAIVVADTGGIDDHGIQLFNLTKTIYDAEQYQSQFDTHSIYNVPKEDITVYDKVGRCHNVYVDEDFAHLYALGSNGTNGNKCGSGLHIIDINEPSNPTFIACYDEAGYVHDAQCVRYHGPDSEYQDHEICFMFTPDTNNLTIVDVTDPQNITEISSTTYFTASYNHQGWITSNHEYLLLDDETDEGPLPDIFPVTQNKTTTYIFDVRDLKHVDYRRAHHSEILAVDHNQYIVDNGHEFSSSEDKFRGYTFQANYEAGLRILSVDNIANENGNILKEIAFFDVYPWKLNANGSVYDEIKFFGAWSVYPYFNKLGTNPRDHIYSNTLVVQSTTTGLYVLHFNGNMDFSADGKESSVFEWNSWYGYTLMAAIVFVCGCFVFMGYKVCVRRQINKKMSLYEDMVAIDDANETTKGGYGTYNDSDSSQKRIEGQKQKWNV